MKLVEERKTKIQEKLRTEMSLHVDQVRSSGIGSSNTANTLRLPFAGPAKTAKLYNIFIINTSIFIANNLFFAQRLDENALERCSVILQVLTSSNKINTN